jgi:hypothetical protein
MGAPEQSEISVRVRNLRACQNCGILDPISPQIDSQGIEWRLSGDREPNVASALI